MAGFRFWSSRVFFYIGVTVEKRTFFLPLDFDFIDWTEVKISLFLFKMASNAEFFSLFGIFQLIWYIDTIRI